MAATRDIQRRIRSVTNTRKITKAMELVASVKMRKASQAVLATRPYANRAWDMLLNVAGRTKTERHPLLRVAEQPRKIAVVVIASNRGLVGGFNSALTAAVAKYMREVQATTGAEVEAIIMGAKGRMIHVQHGHTISAEFQKEDIITSTIEVRPLARLVIDGFIAEQYDRVIVAYMDYISSLVQKPRLRQILPLSQAEVAAGTAGVAEEAERASWSVDQHEYLFEPDADQVLEALLPRLVEMQLYRAVLETNASEHAARMVAMRNATDSAEELIDDLTLSFNQARQASITQDLSEISAGRAALEG